MSNYTTPNFLDFIVRKHFAFEEIEQEMSDRLIEDEFNSDIAEKALDIAFDLYPDDQVGRDNEDLMELRHEFVSEFMEYVRSEVTKKWASNLGMYTKEEAQKNVDTQREVCKKYWTKKVDLARNEGYDDGVNDTFNKFRKMSSYQFSAWKLGVPANDKDQDRIMEQVEDSVFYDAKYGEDEFDPCDLDITIDNSSMKDDNLPSEYQPQDSEDECWEQMKIMQQQANNNHSQDI